MYLREMEIRSGSVGDFDAFSSSCSGKTSPQWPSHRMSHSLPYGEPPEGGDVLEEVYWRWRVPPAMSLSWDFKRTSQSISSSIIKAVDMPCSTILKETC